MTRGKDSLGIGLVAFLKRFSSVSGVSRAFLERFFEDRAFHFGFLLYSCVHLWVSL